LNWVNILVALLSAISLLISIGTAVWSWFSKGNARIAEALDRVVNKQIDHDRRIQSVEEKLPHLPTAKQVSDLVTEVRTNSERLNSVREEMHRQGEGIRRIEDVMLKD